MKIHKILMLLFLFAQKESKEFNEDFEKAQELSDNERFDEALRIYLDLAKIDSLNSNLNFNIGICYLHSRTQKPKAIRYLEKAIACAKQVCTKKEDEDHQNAFKFLGDAYHMNYQFDLAIETYEKYLGIAPDHNNHEMRMEALREIEMCRVGKELILSPVKVKIENLGNAINGTYADYSPVLSADESTMIFTTRRSQSTGGKLDEFGLFFEDIYITHKIDSIWSQAVSIGAPINTDGNEATVGISVDGQIILIYKDDNGDGNLYSTTLNGDQWTSPQKLNDNINTKGWEPSAFISPDGNILYFTSNREGGFGGRDIYKSNKLPNGEWAKASNLGPIINTPFDEDAPFIHPDGVTLYFSSHGHKTMGGFDIFSTHLNAQNEWTSPVNIGYPINSTEDDIFYVVSPDNKRAYYSSFKEGGIGEKDNYMITFAEYKEPPLTLLKGKITDICGRIPPVVEIIVTDNETEKIVGIYHSNSKTGQYLFILTPGKNYNITYEAEGYLFHSENLDVLVNTNYYVIHKPIQLEPIVVGSKIVLNNIFFDFDKATLRPISKVELTKLFKLLDKNKELVVEISAHTDSKGSDEYNVNLSQERAQSVVNYLISKGIRKNQMVAKGYGESQPVANNTNSDGSDNPVNRQLNRRVELKVISFGSSKNALPCY